MTNIKNNSAGITGLAVAVITEAKRVEERKITYFLDLLSEGESFPEVAGVWTFPDRREFPQWLRGPCGEFWCEVADVNPQVLYDACREHGWVQAREPYSEIVKCPTCE